MWQRSARIVTPGSGLGILRRDDASKYAQPVPLAHLEPGLRARLEGGDLLTVSKTNRLSTVHRRVPMDYVAVRRVDAAGRSVGELLVLGLFTSQAYMEQAGRIPLLRRKLRRIVESEDLIEGSHDYKTAVSIFESFPKDELFAADVEELRRQVRALVDLQERRGVWLLHRRDLHGRSVSLLVAMPRDRFSAALRHRLQDLFRERFGGTNVDYHLSLGDTDPAQLHFMVHVPEGEIPDVSFVELEREVVALTRTWDDRLREHLAARHGERRGLWLDEALTGAEVEASGAQLPLAGSIRCDVCVVGGGYTGLWTALRLKELEPALDVVVLEADLCGSGASGRNGGFALSWWAKLRTLLKLCGEEEALRLGRAAEAAVAEIGRFCDDHGIDARYRAGGWLWAATTPFQIGNWEATVAACEGHGIDVFTRVSAAEMAARTGSPVHLGGVWERTAATVQPALLARGLLRVARGRGVRVFERSAVTRVGERVPVVETKRGTVTATTVVLAINAWAAALPELRRAILPMSSDMIATAPMPERLAAIGWTGGEAISDARTMVHYYRTTGDGRIAFGRGGEAHGYLGRVTATLEVLDRRGSRTERGFRRAYPMLADVPITHRWTGAVDRSETNAPIFGRLRSNRAVLYGVGYSGNGVAPSWVGGRVLASTALGLKDEWSETGLHFGLRSLFPPDPVRFVGGILVREAIRREESAAEAGKQAGRGVRAIASLAPAGAKKGAVAEG